MGEKKRGSRRLYGGIGIGVAVAVAIGLAVSLSSYTPSSESELTAEVAVFPPGSTPYGKTYEEWLVDWWSILQSQPISTNPAADTTGELCHVGQDDLDVWFTFGNYGGSTERECTLSSPKAIGVNIITSECSYAEDSSLDTDEKRRQCVIAGAKRATLSLSVNGQEISNLQDYWVEAPIHNFVLPEDNLWGVPSGPTDQYVGGYMVIIEPLPPGEHIVHFSGAALSIEGTQLFALEVTYNLTVEESAA